ncbi:MAG: hypothetical protein IPN77_33405 [Sandaracinaceae bacterium]|nr:hypothetical protein [Sandaracinaceae bacterium]
MKVWRLWNLRAHDEREYYGILHTDVHMGIAVQPHLGARAPGSRWCSPALPARHGRPATA